MKRVFSIVLCMAMALSAWSEHIAEIGIRGGASGLTYRSDYGRLSPGFNAGADLMYTYMSNVGVGIRLGVSYDFATSYFTANDYMDSYSHTCPLAGATPSVYDEVNYSIGSYKDCHQQMYASVPVELAFRYKHWLLFVGPKMMLPISMKYSAVAKEANMAFHHTNPSIWMGEGYSGGAVESLGACVQDDKREGDIVSRPKFWAAVALETGYEIEINQRNSIVLSVFAEYGVNTANVKATTNRSLLDIMDNPEYSPLPNATAPIHNRVLTSSLEANNKGNQLVTGYNYFSAGIKLAWMIHWGNKQAYRTNRICHCTDLEF